MTTTPIESIGGAAAQKYLTMRHLEREKKKAYSARRFGFFMALLFGYVGGAMLALGHYGIAVINLFPFAICASGIAIETRKLTKLGTKGLEEL